MVDGVGNRSGVAGGCGGGNEAWRKRKPISGGGAFTVAK